MENTNFLKIVYFDEAFVAGNNKSYRNAHQARQSPLLIHYSLLSLI